VKRFVEGDQVFGSTGTRFGANVDRFTVTAGQLLLMHPDDVFHQIERVIVENPETALFVFPEFATQDGINLRQVAYLQEDPDAREEAKKWLGLVPEFSRVRVLADEHGQALLVGTIAQQNNRLYSRATFYDPQRGQLTRYDKAHVHWTETFLRPGFSIDPIETRLGTLGVLICYDMAFVEATRALGLQGAEVLFALSAIPMDFDWQYTHRRMIGAAIFNQTYVVAAHLGHTVAAPMGGYSGIYGPEGELIVQLQGAGFGCISAEIDLGHVRRWRERERIAPYRRPRLYGALTERTTGGD
jgi:predicted amidohydrolase